MTKQTKRGPARRNDGAQAHDPQELERILVARENGGDVDGMVALFEPQAVID